MHISSLSFKHLTDKDLPEIQALFKKAFPDLPEEDLEISWNYRSVTDSYGILFKKTLIGFILASYHKHSGSSLYIDYFALDERYRGNGFGTQLLTYFLTLFLETKGSIHLFPLNDTIANWYIKYGFQQSGKGYYVIHSHKTRSSLACRQLYTNN